jgi:alginate O-acetyltransferase complex protein AlgI
VFDLSFDSLEFLIFFILFLAILPLVRMHALWQQVVITFFSAFFYFYNESQFFIYFFILSVLNLALANLIGRLRSWSKLLLLIALVLNIGTLITGKYFGAEHKHFPLGLSFFIFQLISYMVDLQKNTASLPRGFWHFQSYMFYFPHLISGPICRAQGLLHQLSFKLPKPNPVAIRSGFYLVIFGLLKKAVLADALSIRIDEIFKNPLPHHGVIVWMLVLFSYGWQIYFDFSGYTDMARGMGKIMGIDLPLNFNFPYFAKSPKEFWQRWHISLSQWFRDYVYFPLGGSQTSGPKAIVAMVVTFLLSALWHGFGWNFLLWGIWHASWLLIFRYFFKNLPLSISQGMTFFIVILGWLFFRAQNLNQVAVILKLMPIPRGNFHFFYNSYRDLIYLSILCLLVENGAHWFKTHYQSLPVKYADAVWVLVALISLTCQSPLHTFIYARF